MSDHVAATTGGGEPVIAAVGTRGMVGHVAAAMTAMMGHMASVVSAAMVCNSPVMRAAMMPATAMMPAAVTSTMSAAAGHRQGGKCQSQ